MGNRGGALHNDERTIVRQHKGHRWIACFLEFKGRRRSVMTRGCYTELFFLDEAVALAAGHRPCAECRRERFNRFRIAWRDSHSSVKGDIPLAPEIDAQLHHARIDSQGRKVTWEAPLATLPDGCFVHIDAAAYLVHGDGLLRWSPEGYIGKVARTVDLKVTVLTPKPIVQCIRQGYTPALHSRAAPFCGRTVTICAGLFFRSR